MIGRFGCFSERDIRSAWRDGQTELCLYSQPRSELETPLHRRRLAALCLRLGDWDGTVLPSTIHDRRKWRFFRSRYTKHIQEWRWKFWVFGRHRAEERCWTGRIGWDINIILIMLVSFLYLWCLCFVYIVHRNVLMCKYWISVALLGGGGGVETFEF